MNSDSLDNKINIVTLGCSKNLVDSEVLIHQLKRNNIIVEHNSDNFDSKIVIINTCGFIDDAKEESINKIYYYVKAKIEGKINKLYVVGCLSEKYKNLLIEKIPEVDKYYGVNYLQDIISTFKLKYYKDLIYQREITTPGHYAYLKISEGCNRKCSFCSIPFIRGKYISKPIDLIVKEAEYLANTGVKEIILIAQDLTYYGIDLYKKPSLSVLISEISKIPNIEWIRLHYAYPANFPLNLIKIIKENPKVCKYIDIPFQHISDNMLRKMLRGTKSEYIQNLIDIIRNEIPEVAIRTTLLVGHPGETKKDFNLLKEFVIKNRFERLGVFTYSSEENTYSYCNYKNNIPNKIKNERFDEIMNIQKEISLQLNQAKINKYYKVIIDKNENGKYIGRTEFDSPEVDNEVKIKNNNLIIGNYYNVKIISASEYDIIGKLVE